MISEWFNQFVSQRVSELGIVDWIIITLFVRTVGLLADFVLLIVKSAFLFFAGRWFNRD